MRILLTNDDGVYSPGIHVLYDILSEEHDVLILAPETDKSGCSSSIQLHMPLRVRCISSNTYSCSGSPVDCFMLTRMQGSLFENPELLISGINIGQNTGGDIWYSGTVAAACQAAYYNVPAMAISLVVDNTGDKRLFYFDAVKKYIASLWKEWFTMCRTRYFLNINIPNNQNIPLDYMQTIPMRNFYRGESVFHQMSENMWMVETTTSAEPLSSDSSHKEDRLVVQQGYVSVSLLSADAIQDAAYRVKEIL